MLLHLQKSALSVLNHGKSSFTRCLDKDLPSFRSLGSLYEFAKQSNENKNYLEMIIYRFILLSI